MKKGFKWFLGAAMAFVLVGCGGNGDTGSGSGSGAANPTTPVGTTPPAVVTTTVPEATSNFGGPVNAVTREEGSGTRTAFVEIVNITIEGNDNIDLEAIVAPGTSVMMTTVAGNPQSIGYASTGVALADDRIRVLSVDGIAPTVENMLNGTYPISRPFLIAYPAEAGLNQIAQDFVDFIMSAQGQAVVSGRGYVPVDSDGPEFTVTPGLSGRIVVNGSSSLYSLMGHLSAAYRELNPGVEIDIHGAGTGHGISAARDGLADIALSSRDLRPAELEFLNPMTIAIDGIAVIVHPDNDIVSLTIDQIREIFLGNVSQWSEVR